MHAGRGFAPMRLSSFADERVKAKAKVGPGTTRHLETVKWTIDNVMASEPDMPLWAGYSTNELPTELGKLVTGQDYGGDAKKCMDAVAAMIDAKNERRWIAVTTPQVLDGGVPSPPSIFLTICFRLLCIRMFMSQPKNSQPSGVMPRLGLGVTTVCEAKGVNRVDGNPL